jgi:hypothetical protein
MMRFIERLEQHYEVQEVPFGRSYTWCPECIVVECDCSVELTFKISALTGVGAVCACGADLTTDIQEKLQGHQPEVWAQRLEDYQPTEHPWHHDTEARADQHLQDEATYGEGSPWRYNDITCRGLEDERDVQ